MINSMRVYSMNCSVCGRYLEDRSGCEFETTDEEELLNRAAKLKWEYNQDLYDWVCPCCKGKEPKW